MQLVKEERERELSKNSLLIACYSSYVCFAQLVKEDIEKQLAKGRFTSDMEIFQAMDDIAGTSGATMYDRNTILTFLRSKLYVIEKLEELDDVPQPPSPQPQPKVSVVVIKLK